MYNLCLLLPTSANRKLPISDWVAWPFSFPDYIAYLREVCRCRDVACNLNLSVIWSALWGHLGSFSLSLGKWSSCCHLLNTAEANGRYVNLINPEITNTAPITNEKRSQQKCLQNTSSLFACCHISPTTLARYSLFDPLMQLSMAFLSWKGGLVIKIAQLCILGSKGAFTNISGRATCEIVSLQNGFVVWRGMGSQYYGWQKLQEKSCFTSWSALIWGLIRSVKNLCA